MGNRLKGRKPAKKIPPSQVRYLKRLSLGPKAYAIGNSSLTALDRRGLVARDENSVGCFHQMWRITPAGRAALAQEGGGE
jgi:hypothetical protein